MELIMFVGIPTSGKSTRSEQYRQQGYLVLSSDEIRENLLAQTNPGEMIGKEKTNIHSRVFEQIRKRTGEALKRGQSVVVDATNLGRKRRMNFPGSPFVI